MSDGNKNPEKTGRHPPFAPGNPGSPGRPKGSRNKLGEAFIADLHEVWKAKGKAAIERVVEERPQDFLKVVASLQPKQIEIKEDAFGDLTDEQLAAIISAARSTIGVSGESGEGTGAPTSAKSLN